MPDNNKSTDIEVEMEKLTISEVDPQKKLKDLINELRNPPEERDKSRWLIALIEKTDLLLNTMDGYGPYKNYTIFHLLMDWLLGGKLNPKNIFEDIILMPSVYWNAKVVEQRTSGLTPLHLFLLFLIENFKNLEEEGKKILPYLHKFVCKENLAWNEKIVTHESAKEDKLDDGVTPFWLLIYMASREPHVAEILVTLIRHVSEENLDWKAGPLGYEAGSLLRKDQKAALKLEVCLIKINELSELKDSREFLVQCSAIWDFLKHNEKDFKEAYWRCFDYFNEKKWMEQLTICSNLVPFINPYYFLIKMEYYRSLKKINSNVEANRICLERFLINFGKLIKTNVNQKFLRENAQRYTPLTLLLDIILSNKENLNLRYLSDLALLSTNIWNEELKLGGTPFLVFLEYLEITKQDSIECWNLLNELISRNEINWNARRIESRKSALGLFMSMIVKGNEKAFKLLPKVVESPNLNWNDSGWHRVAVNKLSYIMGLNQDKEIIFVSPAFLLMIATLHPRYTEARELLPKIASIETFKWGAIQEDTKITPFWLLMHGVYNNVPQAWCALKMLFEKNSFKDLNCGVYSEPITLYDVKFPKMTCLDFSVNENIKPFFDVLSDKLKIELFSLLNNQKRYFLLSLIDNIKVRKYLFLSLDDENRTELLAFVKNEIENDDDLNKASTKTKMQLFFLLSMIKNNESEFPNRLMQEKENSSQGSPKESVHFLNSKPLIIKFGRIRRTKAVDYEKYSEIIDRAQAEAKKIQDEREKKYIFKG